MGSGAARLLPEIARRVPSRLAEVVSRLPETESYWDVSVRDAFAIVAEGDLDAARKAAEAMTGPNREQSLAGIAMAWGRRDFNAAIAWARTLPEGTDQNQIIRAALIGEAAVNPAAAMEFGQPGSFGRALRALRRFDRRPRVGQGRRD